MYNPNTTTTKYSTRIIIIIIIKINFLQIRFYNKVPFKQENTQSRNDEINCK